MRGRSEQCAAYTALLLIGLLVGLTIRYSSFVAVLADPAGYVGAAERWLERDLFHPVHFQLLPGWPNHADAGSALGFRASPISGTDVSEYPQGFPIFLAASMALVGEMGPYLAGSFFFALLALCAYRLGLHVAGPWCGLIAACVIAISPVTLRHVIHPMSDVGAAAFWMVAWLMSLRPGLGAAAAAGAAVTAAVTMRPNLAPLALVVGGVLVFSDRGEGRPSPLWPRAIVFIASSAIGPALVLWIQQVLYGSALTPGYKGAAEFFKWAHVRGSLVRYPAWLFEVHTPITLIALLAPVLQRLEMGMQSTPRARLIVISALAMVLGNFALYLPYLNFEQWTYLRFMLPAMTALFVLFAAVVVAFAKWLARRSRLLVPLALVPIAIVVARSVPLVNDALVSGPREMRVLMMVRYLREALPRNAVVFAEMHGGSVANYTRRPIVRLDTVPPQLLDAEVARLELRGQQPVFVLDEAYDSGGFRQYFAPSQFSALDWPPRAEFASPGAIWYMIATDRAPYRAGARWPMDILHWPN